MIRVAECDAEGGLVDVCMRTGNLPRRALPSCGGGPVLVYHAPFEATILGQLAESFPTWPAACTPSSAASSTSCRS